jgi:LysM repeat protein
MRLDGKRGAGLRGALALLFIAGAGGAAYAFAKRDAAPPPALESVLLKGTSADLTAVAPPAPAPAAPEKAPPAGKVVETGTMKAGDKNAPAAAPKPPEASASDVAALAAEGETALAKGDERLGLLLLRKAAKTVASPEQKAAAARLGAIATAALVDADKAKEAGDLSAERAALSRAFFAQLDREARKPLRERLDDLVKKLVFTTRATPDGDIYVVKPGDRLIHIARSNKTTWAFIKRVNGLKTDAIRSGQKLKIPKGQVDLAVWKSDFMLIATIGGRYLKAWDVGTGRDDRTPESTFKIAERIEKPTWYSPDGKVYPFGEKENILGTRWLGFERTEEFSGFGIHGTAFPDTIGTEASMGCIRMRNENVEEVYDLVSEGAEVRIVR